MQTPSEFAGWCLVIGSVSAYLVFRQFDVSLLLRELTFSLLGEDFVKIDLHMSKDFLSSYIVGGLIAVHLIGIAAISCRISSVVRSVERPVRYLASFTFALYLFHYPLLEFFTAIAPNEVGAVRSIAIIAATLISVWALGLLTEHRKQDYKWALNRIVAIFGHQTKTRLPGTLSD